MRPNPGHATTGGLDVGGERLPARRRPQGAITAAVEALGRGLALDRAPVRVNTVPPDLIDSPFWRDMPDDRRRAMVGRVAGSVPVHRAGRPEDVAQAILAVAADPFATGSTVVDGGAAIA